MKKSIKYLTLICAVAAIGTAAYFLKENLSTSSAASAGELEPITKKANGLNVMVDPRIELISALESSGEYDKQLHLLTTNDFTYKADMNKYFSKYSKHEAAITFDDMSKSGFAYDAPLEMVLHLSNPPSLQRKQNFSNRLKSVAAEVKLNEFTDKLYDFGADTRFYKFYNSHKDFYQAVVDKNAEALKAIDYVKLLEQYYGTKYNSYNVILSPINMGYYGASVQNADGNSDLYCTIGDFSIENDTPVFRDNKSAGVNISFIFSSFFTRPLVEQNREEIYKYSDLFIPIYENMKQSYSSWDSCAGEHILLAAVARINYQMGGKEDYDRTIRLAKENSFFYTEALAEKLQEYEQNRDKYKTFESFFPELLKVFKELNEKDLGKDFYKL